MLVSVFASLFTRNTATTQGRKPVGAGFKARIAIGGHRTAAGH
jgi:hypothetical protein